MKSVIFSFILLSISVLSFGQRKMKNEMKVVYTQLPNCVMQDVSTYAIAWDVSEIKKDVPEVDITLGYTEQTIKGYLALQGYTYTEDNPDVKITLHSQSFNMPLPEIVNTSSKKDEPNYRATYITPINWKITIEGKYNNEILLSDFKKDTKIYVPALKDKFGMPGQIVPKAEDIENHLKSKQEQVYNYVLGQAVGSILATAKQAVNSELSFQRKVKEVEILSFKSTKKMDMSVWDEPYAKAQALLKELSNGADPLKLYQENTSVFDFWAAQFNANKSENGNRKIKEFAASNLVEVLLVINPEQIKPEYLQNCYTGKYKSRDWLCKFVEKAKQRQANNASKNFDYKLLAKNAPLLKNSFYEVSYVDAKGKSNNGVIVYTSPYGMNPIETTGYSMSIYKSEDVIAAAGMPSNKAKLDLKTIKQYQLLGYKYERVKYTDPTAMSLSGNDQFLEVVATGKCKLYKTYSMESGGGMIVGGGLKNNSDDQLKTSRSKPQFIITTGKKPTVVFNFKKLASMMSDCKVVADKIKAGAYGNDVAKKESNSKFGKMVQRILNDDIEENVIRAIVDEYNSLM